MQEVHLLRRLHRDVLFLGFSDGVVPCDWLCGFLVLSSLFLVSVSCFFVCLGAGFHVGFYFAYVSVVPLFVRGRLPHGGRAWRPRRVPCISSSRCFVFSHVFFSGLGSCMHFPYFSGCAEVFLPNGETSTVGSLLVDCRGCGTGPGRAARCAWLRSMCVWGDRPDGGGLSGHGPHEPGPPADLPIWSLDRGPVDGDAIVRPGPWTRGGPRGRPRMGFRVDHVFGWSAEWTVVRQGGPRDHPLHGPRSVRAVRDAGPHMGFRVGRMIGPACGPLAHSHDVVRKRAGHADGPHASTWPIRPPGPWSRTPAMAHTAWA